MKTKIFWIFSLVLCSAAICLADASSDFKAAVQAGGKEFSAAVTAKDAARVGALYATDAIALPPNSEMLKGQAAIQAFWKGLIDGGLSGQVEAIETELDGKFGIEVGKYTIMDSSGKTVDQGKYVVVWKKEGGKWKMYRDIWNSNMPAPAPTK